ncbi:MAG: hypothetical protein ACUVQ8_03775 [Nitrososphaeria archaeon]
MSWKNERWLKAWGLLDDTVKDNKRPGNRNFTSYSNSASCLRRTGAMLDAIDAAEISVSSPRKKSFHKMDVESE